MPETHTIEVTTYTLEELKELGGRAYDNALETLADWATDYGWWETELEYWILEQVQERWGITFTPKEVTFDLDRGDFFCFGRTSSIDDKVFLKAAGIDLRTRAARAIYEDGGHLVLGTRHSIGVSRNWIGFYEYEYVPGYIEDMQPGITEKIEDALRDAQNFALKVLKDELDNLRSEEYAIDMAEANEYRWDETGAPA